MRHLPKHLRPRYRYLAVEIETWPDATLDHTSFQGAVWEAARSLLGDADSAAIDLQVIETDFWTGGGSSIVRVRRGSQKQARATVACVSTVDGEPVRVGVRGIGGTINAARSSYLGGPPGQIDSEPIQFREESGTAVHRRDRVDVDLGNHFVGTTPEAL